VSECRPNADDWLQRLGFEVIWRDLVDLTESVVPPVIMLKCRTTPREQRWYLFHAIGHVALHRGNQLYLLKSGQTAAVNKQERQADEWAACTLMPPGELLKAITSGMDTEELADHFGVPLFAVEIAIGLFGRRRSA
jgi:Zn-dependent peptidase ImmA (M78 family)